MEVLGHFLFEIVKISLLTCIYTPLAVIILWIIGKRKREGWLKKSSEDIWTTAFFSGLTISVLLFLFMCTYFGDHGLGDSAKVPIGHFKVVKQINGSSTYIEKSGGEQLGIAKFAVRNGKLYAATEPNSENENDFVIWDLKNDDWTLCKKESDYYTADINAPRPNQFRDFQEVYADYWNGWRFWLLP